MVNIYKDSLIRMLHDKTRMRLYAGEGLAAFELSLASTELFSGLGSSGPSCVGFSPTMPTPRRKIKHKIIPVKAW